MIKGTLHARIKRGEDTRERRRLHHIQKYQAINFKINQTATAHVPKIPAPTGTPFIKQSIWSRIVAFFRKLFYGKKMLEV